MRGSLPWMLLLTLGASLPAVAEDEAKDAEEVVAATERSSDGSSPENPRTMSGMSILGNEEAPKSLVIVPWKSSELGDDLAFTDSLDDRARPLDREVFARELRYYAIRSRGEATE